MKFIITYIIFYLIYNSDKQVDNLNISDDIKFDEKQLTERLKEMKRFDSSTNKLSEIIKDENSKYET
jgi:hypothetical protein